MTAKLEAELAPGSVVWSVDPLRLRGATMQEAEPSDPPEEGKPAKKPVMITVPAGGLVFLRRFHVAAQWSLDVPFHVYLRVPAPPASLRPAWPISIETATAAASSHGGTPAIGCYASVGCSPVGDALHRCERGCLWRTRDRRASRVHADEST